MVYKNICKYCKKEFEFYNWRFFASHVGNCKMNPNIKEKYKKISESKKKGKIKLFMCKKCEKIFEQYVTLKSYKKQHCSRHCANSRIQTKKINEKRRKKLKQNAIDKLILRICPICKTEYKTSPKKLLKTCGNIKCQNKLRSIKSIGKKQSIKTIQKRIKKLKNIKNKYKGKTYEEIYGKEKANEIKEKLIKNNGSKRPEVRKKMRNSMIKHIIKYKGNFRPNIGKNEKHILDNIEKEIKLEIIRQYHIKSLDYFVDGYCIHTNTVYEIDERPKKNERDIRREKEIKEELNCIFIRIKDY